MSITYCSLCESLLDQCHEKRSQKHLEQHSSRTMSFFVLIFYSIFIPIAFGGIPLDNDVKQIWPKFVNEILQEKELNGCQVVISFGSSQQSKDVSSIVKFLKSSNFRQILQGNVVYFNQRMHAWTCVCMVKNNEKHSK